MQLNDNGGYFDWRPTTWPENYRRDIALELEALGFEIRSQPPRSGVLANTKSTEICRRPSFSRQYPNSSNFIVKSVARRQLTRHLHAQAYLRYCRERMHCNISL